MRPSVATIFPAFTERFEGSVNCLYLDVKGLVTTGRGDLVDPVSLALSLPWRHLNGALASSAEVVAEWSRIKAATWLAREGWRSAKAMSTLFLTPSAIDALTLEKLRENDAALAARIAGWEDLPADAQLAVHSMCWADGVHGVLDKFPKFEAALARRDYMTCANECHLDAIGNPGLIPRNAANDALFVSAAHGGDPATVNGWLPSSSEEITAPDLPIPEMPASDATLPGAANSNGSIPDDVA